MDKTEQCQTETTPTEDRRRSTRYLIPALTSFRWETRDGHWDSAIGTTRDIATSGLFVESESIPPVDSVLQLIVTLPERSKFGTTIRLRGTAIVCHVQQEPCQTSGFGVVAVFHPESPVGTKHTTVGEKQCDA
jgi:hypothetical protein